MVGFIFLIQANPIIIIIILILIIIINYTYILYIFLVNYSIVPDTLLSFDLTKNPLFSMSNT